jgi:hypothetical protein
MSTRRSVSLKAPQEVTRPTGPGPFLLAEPHPPCNGFTAANARRDNYEPRNQIHVFRSPRPC